MRTLYSAKYYDNDRIQYRPFEIRTRLLTPRNDRTWGTNFELGVVTRGYRCRYDSGTQTWDPNFVQETTIHTLGQSAGRPIIWIYNDNAEQLHQAWGASGSTVGHWEGFAGPGVADTAHRVLVRNWNLATAMREDTQAGVWRVTAKQAAVRGQLAVEVGAFVHEVPTPAGLQAPSGSRYMATADNRSFGVVPKTSLIRVDLNPLAPTAVPGGAEHRHTDESGSESERERATLIMI